MIFKKPYNWQKLKRDFLNSEHFCKREKRADYLKLAITDEEIIEEMIPYCFHRLLGDTKCSDFDCDGCRIEFLDKNYPADFKTRFEELKEKRK